MRWRSRPVTGAGTCMALVVSALVSGALGLPVPATAGSTTSGVGEPVRIMVQGDSISHGSSGDLTWRWFLDRHLRGVAVDLVGPRSGPWGGDPANPDVPGVYADPDFDSDHAATWGDSLLFPQPYESATVTHRPDVVVLELGANDLTFFQVPPASVVELVTRRITRLRELVPGVDVVLCDSTLVDRPQVVEYNALLPDLVEVLDTPAERVVLAPMSRGYVVGTELTAEEETTAGHTWDQAHPNAQGQQHIAAAVSDALASLGVGTPYPRPLTRVAETAAPWRQLDIAAATSSTRITWTRPEGATSVDLYLSSQGAPWTRVSKANTGWSWQQLDLPACSVQQVKLQARKGYTLLDDFSPTVAAVVGEPLVSDPELSLTGLTHGARARWTWPDRGCSGVLRWQWTTPSGSTGSRVDPINGTLRSATVDGLPAGTRVNAVLQVTGAQDTLRVSRQVTALAASVALRAARPRVVQRGRRSITFGWQAPTPGADALVQVKVSGTWRAVQEMPRSRTRWRVQGLAPRTPVRFRVRYRDGAVRGAWSPVRITTTRS